jgi:hypothetical protein
MQRTHLMQRGKARIAQILCLLALLTAPLTSQGEPLTVGNKAVQEQSSQRSAMQVYKDPATGQLKTPPAIAAHPEQAKALQRALSTSAEGLVARPSLGGGIRVHLQGRFRHTATVTRDANGALSVQCDNHMPPQP